MEDENSLMYARATEDFVGPQYDDIAGIQYLYGTGDDRLGAEELNGDFLSDSSDVTAVPVPAAFWLLLSGCGFFATMRKRIAH